MSTEMKRLKITLSLLNDGSPKRQKILHGTVVPAIFFAKLSQSLKTHSDNGTGGPHLTHHHNRVPHLRDSLIVAKVGHFRGSESPDTLNSPMPSGLKRF